MQALYRDTAVASIPRPYLNHVPSQALNHGETEHIQDVTYLEKNDLQLRKEISKLLTALGMKVVSIASAVEHMAFAGRDAATCVISDIYISEISGLELQGRLAEKENIPVILASDRCEIPSAVSAMKTGASA